MSAISPRRNSERLAKFVAHLAVREDELHCSDCGGTLDTRNVVTPKQAVGLFKLHAEEEH